VCVFVLNGERIEVLLNTHKKCIKTYTLELIELVCAALFSI